MPGCSQATVALSYLHIFACLQRKKEWGGAWVSHKDWKMERVGDGCVSGGGGLPNWWDLEMLDGLRWRVVGAGYHAAHTPSPRYALHLMTHLRNAFCKS
jgi:hypothetical protein